MEPTKTVTVVRKSQELGHTSGCVFLDIHEALVSHL